jgi:RNA polymerase sigma-70 factor (ECF subfamily)
MLVYDREISLEMPAYFVALDFDCDRVVSIHDFLFARYAMDGVDFVTTRSAPAKDTSEGDRVRTT